MKVIHYHGERSFSCSKHIFFFIPVIFQNGLATLYTCSLLPFPFSRSINQIPNGLSVVCLLYPRVKIQKFPCRAFSSHF